MCVRVGALHLGCHLLSGTPLISLRVFHGNFLVGSLLLQEPAAHLHKASAVLHLSSFIALASIFATIFLEKE